MGMCIHTWNIFEHHYSQCGYIRMQNVFVPSYVSLSIYVHLWEISKFSYDIVCICMYICTISENECMVTCMPFPCVISYHGHVYSHMCSFQSSSYADMGIHMVTCYVSEHDHMTVCISMSTQVPWAMPNISAFTCMKPCVLFPCHGRLNENGPSRLICLNSWSVVGGTFWEN